MVEALHSIGVKNDNYGTKALKYGTVAGTVGAVIGASAGALFQPHMTLEINGKSERFFPSNKFIKQAILNLDDTLLNESELFCKQILGLNPRNMTIEKYAELIAKNRNLFEQTCEMSFEEAKQLALNEVKGDIKLLEKEIKNLQTESITEMRVNKFAKWFDEGGFLKKVNDNASEITKKTRESLSKTVRNFRIKSAGKVALIGAGILGVLGLAIGACNKKEPPNSV